MKLLEFIHDLDKLMILDGGLAAALGVGASSCFTAHSEMFSMEQIHHMIIVLIKDALDKKLTFFNGSGQIGEG